MQKCGAERMRKRCAKTLPSNRRSSRKVRCTFVYGGWRFWGEIRRPKSSSGRQASLGFTQYRSLIVFTADESRVTRVICRPKISSTRYRERRRRRRRQQEWGSSLAESEDAAEARSHDGGEGGRGEGEDLRSVFCRSKFWLICIT